MKRFGVDFIFGFLSFPRGLLGASSVQTMAANLFSTNIRIVQYATQPMSPASTNIRIV
jgi:hypothetical protein